MHRHARGLVDDYHVVVLVNDSYCLRRDRRLMAVQGMRYYVAVLDERLDGGGFLPIDDNFPTLYGVFLDIISTDPLSKRWYQT